MREKKDALIITFASTTQAMAVEKHCHANDLPGLIIPVPRAITAGCGLSWCAPLERRSEIEALVKAESMDYDGFYEIPV